MRAGCMEELALHPTVKPVQMIAVTIKDVSGRGDIVLQVFKQGGSEFACRLACNRPVRIPQSKDHQETVSVASDLTNSETTPSDNAT
jgi:hypothetical protein